MSAPVCPKCGTSLNTPIDVIVWWCKNCNIIVKDEKLMEKLNEQNQKKIINLKPKQQTETFVFKTYEFKTEVKNITYDLDNYHMEVEITLPNGKKCKAGVDQAVKNLYQDKLEKSMEIMKGKLKRHILNVMNDFVREREEEDLRTKFQTFLETYAVTPEELAIEKL